MTFNPNIVVDDEPAVVRETRPRVDADTPLITSRVDNRDNRGRTLFIRLGRVNEPAYEGVETVKPKVRFNASACWIGVIKSMNPSDYTIRREYDGQRPHVSFSEIALGYKIIQDESASEVRSVETIEDGEGNIWFRLPNGIKLERRVM